MSDAIERGVASALLVAVLVLGGLASAQPAAAPGAPEEATADDEMVQLDFDDVELPVVIDTIARLTGRNFIYDDRVRGRVTIVSPTRMRVDQAYAVFESVLQVKGFTTVGGPGGVIKIIPIREAKESSIETVRGLRPPPMSDRFVTRLIPLRYIEAEAISNTLKPLVSQNASMVAYPPTNTVILTDAASNIRRLLSILESIDVETYKEELALIRLRYADANTLSSQLTEIFGGETGGVSPTAARAISRRRVVQPTPVSAGQGTSAGTVRILTDERTNSLIVLASRGKLEELRTFVRKLDTPVEGGGRIQVYYLKHADAEELAQTLTALLSGQSGAASGLPGAAGAQPQVLRAAVTELAGGMTVTSDPGTNSLVIQGSPEGYAALVSVIQQLDIPRPQVLVEALIMEVDVTNGRDLGFNGLVRLVRGDTDITLSTVTDAAATAATGALLPGGSVAGGSFLGNLVRQTFTVDADGNITSNGSLIQGLIRASASDNRTNILSAPHILTSDNEEAEILVGDNIPIITSRVAAPTTTTAVPQTPTLGLSTSVNVERQDVGVTLRVTPQITEGDSLRLKIYQEITAINNALIRDTGNPEEVGVPLSSRKIENNVVVSDSETVVIGGLISEDFDDSVTKVPFLGDIPILGWAFKTTSRNLTKKNLLVFLTPHIIRGPEDLEHESIRKREEFRLRSEQAIGTGSAEKEQQRLAEALGPDASLGLLSAPRSELNAASAAVAEHGKLYPLERMREIEEKRREGRARALEAEAAAATAPRYGVLAAVFRDAEAARETLTDLIDAGYEGTLVSGDAGGAVLFELRLGPYDNLEAAERAAQTVRDSFDLEPRVLIEADQR